VKIIQPNNKPRVEVVGGVIRIGEELSAFQELLKHWFYTCSCLGTLVFCVVFYILRLLLGFMWEALKKRRRRQIGSDEPTCELDVDLDDAFDFEDCPRSEEGNTGDEGGFADATTPVERHGAEATSQAGINGETAAHSSRIHVVANDEDDDSDAWEDLYYPTDITGTDVLSAFPSSSTLIPACNHEEQPVLHRTREREMTDEELSELMFMSVQDAVDLTASSAAADVNTRTRTTGNNGAEDSDSIRRRHPFFFFFCW
jgi:hypothetical protein